METIKHAFVVGEHTLTLETGSVARLAESAVVLRMGETVLLSTATYAVNNEPRDFLPLAVHYLEAFYAAGQLPGGYFKRETKPSEREVLISRLIDRSIRPLFPKGYCDEINVVTKTLSYDPMVDTDIPAIIASAATLAISSLPFEGPIAAAKVGRIDDQWVLNPPLESLKESTLDLVLSGSESATIMVEAGSKGLSESSMLDAIDFAHKSIRTICKEVQIFADKVRANNPAEKLHVESTIQADLQDKWQRQYRDDIIKAFKTPGKKARQSALRQLRHKIQDTEMGGMHPVIFSENLSQVEKSCARALILDHKERIDGRALNQVRDIRSQTNLLPRAHGDCLFTRGETQALVVATLGSDRDAQMIDNITGDERHSFMLHYNFPPYCVGEVGMLGAPKRREIGHGRLARRALEAVLPDTDAFPYVIRLVSEITESNGSSSMASVCGGALAMMDAGIPISEPVAGIAMGLVTDGERFEVLSDISGDEDHFGHMDFKVAGTENAITALQMDIKVAGISRSVLERALAQAKEGRLHILKAMGQELSSPRQQISRFAPRVISFHIKPNKIRDVIGKGGSTIREITETYGVTVDVNDDGLVKIHATDADKGEEAKKYIETLTASVEPGQIYQGKVIKIIDCGAIISLLPGQDGLLHISQMSHERVNQVSDHVSEGQVLEVKVLELDRQGRVKLTIKDL